MMRKYRKSTKLLNDKFKSECIICGYHKTYFELKGLEWQYHINEEHNLKKIIWYIIYLHQKHENECSTFEKNLKQKI